MRRSKSGTAFVSGPSWRWIPIPLALAVILVAYGLRSPAERSESWEVRTETIRDAFMRIPKQLGEEATWVELGEVPIPTSQSKMLGLDAYVSRRFRRLRSAQDTTMTFFLAHTPDIRYMTGHHPPQCYPASGWLSRDAGVSEFSIDHPSGIEIKAAVYRFEMPGPTKTIHLTVVNGFLLPVLGSTARLEDTRSLSSSGAQTMLGISQFQLLFEGQISTEDVISYADEVIRGLPASVVELMCSDSGQTGQYASGDGS